MSGTASNVIDGSLNIDPENKNLIETDIKLYKCLSGSIVYKYLDSVKDNEWNGLVKQTHTGYTFYCHFVNNKVVYGKQYTRDRLIYDGEFKDDLYHGRGKLYHTRVYNNVFEGLFKNGHLIDLTFAKYYGNIVKKIQDKIYEIHYESGNRYKGAIYKPMQPIPHGRGYMKYGEHNIYDGFDYEGVFDNGLRTGIGYSTYGLSILIRKWEHDRIVEVYDTIRDT